MYACVPFWALSIFLLVRHPPCYNRGQPLRSMRGFARRNTHVYSHTTGNVYPRVLSRTKAASARLAQDAEVVARIRAAGDRRPHRGAPLTAECGHLVCAHCRGGLPRQQRMHVPNPRCMR